MSKKQPKTPSARRRHFGAGPECPPRFTKAEIQLLYWGLRDLKTTDTKRVSKLTKRLLKLGAKPDHSTLGSSSARIEPAPNVDGRSEFNPDDSNDSEYKRN